MPVIQMPNKNEQNSIAHYLKHITDANYDEMMVIGIKDGDVYSSWSRGSTMINALGLLEILKADLLRTVMET